MPTCQVIIEGLNAGPPYILGDQPGSVSVDGRASDHCQQVRVIVRIAGPGSPAIVDQIVTVDFSQSSNQPGTLPGLVRLFLPLPQLGLRCGDPLFVEMICSQDPSCADSGQFAIHCKPAPASGGGGGGGSPSGGDHDDGGGWTWPPWPPSRCGLSAAGAAMGFLAALATLAIGVGTQTPALTAAALAIAAVAGLSWALWTYWCSPHLCARRIVLCWVFKRAFIAALPVIAFSGSALIILIIIGYGALAGILVELLRNDGCPVPSAKSPFNHLPI